MAKSKVCLADLLCVAKDNKIKFLSVAKHTITGHRVAMKYISKAVILREKTKTRVRREFEYMRTLRHPHIIKLSVQTFLIAVFQDLTI